VQELVGSVRVGARSQHARDDELRRREHLAQHAHEGNRAALTRELKNKKKTERKEEENKGESLKSEQVSVEHTDRLSAPTRLIEPPPSDQFPRAARRSAAHAD
jgi:hypothetical protein